MFNSILLKGVQERLSSKVLITPYKIILILMWRLSRFYSGANRYIRSLSSFFSCLTTKLITKKLKQLSLYILLNY